MQSETLALETPANPHTGCYHAVGFCGFIIQNQFHFDCADCAGVGRLVDSPSGWSGQTGSEGATRFVETVDRYRGGGGGGGGYLFVES